MWGLLTSTLLLFVESWEGAGAVESREGAGESWEGAGFGGFSLLLVSNEQLPKD